MTMSALAAASRIEADVDIMVFTCDPKRCSIRRNASKDRASTVTRAHAEGDGGSLRTGDASAEHDDFRRRHAGNAAEKHATSALRFFKRMRVDLRAQPACDLRHRREQREPAVGVRHGLVSDAGRAGRQQVLRLNRVGREMEVCEQDLVGA
jgi:hypothetical protein